MHIVAGPPPSGGFTVGFNETATAAPLAGSDRNMAGRLWSFPPQGLGKRTVLTKRTVSNRAFCTHRFAFCTHGFLYAWFFVRTVLFFVRTVSFFVRTVLFFCTRGFQP
jgi:hypothetical protein